jgi:uncharacterized repeat protein (TIGR01451 family)
MKLVTTKTVLKLGALAVALLTSQQAMAVGTRAGTAVDNTALVDFEVGGVAQAQLSDSADFVVDRRVDFTLTVQVAGLLPVVPGGPPVGSEYFVEFLLTNTSNSILDFDVALSQMAGGSVNGGANDTTDMATVDWAVGTSVANGDTDPTRGAGPTFIDELEADDAIRIRVYGDAALGMLDGQVAGVQLDLEGREGGGATVLGAVMNDTDPDTALGIENVFVNGNAASAQDGFIAQTAALAVTKDYQVISGDLGSGQPIPGAIVEYTILLDNTTGSADATDVVISDTLDGDVTLQLGVYGGAGDDVQIVVNGGGATTCTASDADADDCGVTAGVLTVDGSGALTIPAGETYEVSFQVLIPDPATTP